MTTPIAAYTTSNDLAIVPSRIDAMAPDEMRAALHRVNKLISVPTYQPPPNGCLVIAEIDTPGSPHVERAIVRSDGPGADDTGMWWEISDSSGFHETWESVLADGASTDGHYVHDSQIADAILGEVAW